MKRGAKLPANRRWPPWILAGAMLALSVTEVTQFAFDTDWAQYVNAGQSVAFKQFEPTSDGIPVSGQQPVTIVSRRSSSRGLERTREVPSLPRLIQDLLHQPTMNPGFTSRLDLCSEFTKPDSLVIRLMGTPKNHRSPPA